jgi:hypothetical protein
MAMTSVLAWFCFQVLFPVDEGDSFLFFFPNNFLNVLNLDFFFPVLSSPRPSAASRSLMSITLVEIISSSLGSGLTHW